ncbi:MAG: penicillin-binding protein [Candidatus Levybacteria bacterium CG10_big_fil_rev_8_21_14_0_10_36_7]|nr:MAG: penicillin-binding protein [Candidatus Levybacteria bacterium CG10_big_fil_rev_8_21_14_0_10_36_7]
MREIQKTLSMKKIKFLKPKLSKKTALFLLAFAIFIGLYFFILKDIPSTTSIGSANYPQSTQIYDRNGKLLYTVFTSKNQTFASFEKMPKNLKNATIATEDKDFYKHGAIDIRGITRAFYSTVFKQQVQGGSTITQQLVKNSLLTPEQTITRKVKEVILSFVVEAIYNKNKILEMYLNQVSYGGTAWGVQAASNLYFNKPVSKLSLAESAFLAGLPEAPSVYSPFGSRPELGKKRQIEVLRKMREQGYITAQEEEKAVKESLSFSNVPNKILAPHFVFYIKELLAQKYGQKVVEQGGLQVTTSLDLDIQNFAQETVASEVAKLKNYKADNGAAIVTNPKTGEILAMVGSKDYFDQNSDGNVNITTAKRQPGSSIKPINYAVGLINGYSAATVFVDKKICFPNPGQKAYCPVNYDGKFHGAVQMRYALANSFNIPAVKMLKLNTVQDMIATASAMGITTFSDPQRYGLSLTLGGGEVMMTEITEAFGVFSSGGYKLGIHPILKVTDSKGKILEEYTPPKSPIFGKRVLPEGVAFIISDILSDNNARSQAFGTNSPLRIGNFPVAVKTGTTNDLRDNWTIGYTPSYVVTTWVGNNDNTPMSGITSGITGAAPIWNKIMRFLIENKPQEPFQKPDNVIGRTVCSTSGLLPPSDGSCPTRFEYFIKGAEPKKSDDSNQQAYVYKDTNVLYESGPTDNIELKDMIIVKDPLGDIYCFTCAHPDESDQAETTQGQ